MDGKQYHLRDVVGRPVRLTPTIMAGLCGWKQHHQLLLACKAREGHHLPVATKADKPVQGTNPSNLSPPMFALYPVLMSVGWRQRFYCPVGWQSQYAFFGKVPVKSASIDCPSGGVHGLQPRKKKRKALVGRCCWPPVPTL